MLDGQNMSEEERLESIKFEIKQLFEGLNFKSENVELEQEIDRQKNITIDALRSVDNDAPLPENVTDELTNLSILLEKASEHLIDEEYMIAQIKVGISQSRVRYEAGKIDSAIQILDGEEGFAEYAYSISRTSNDCKKLSEDIDNLLALLKNLQQSLILK